MGEIAADRIAHRDLEQHLQGRLKERTPSTVDKERTTIIQLFRRAVAHRYRAGSPAAELVEIKGEVDQAPFQTVAEIGSMIARGGLGQWTDIDMMSNSPTSRSHVDRTGRRARPRPWQRSAREDRLAR